MVDLKKGESFYLPGLSVSVYWWIKERETDGGSVLAVPLKAHGFARCQAHNRTLGVPGKPGFIEVWNGRY
jgi:hypothetical protein